MPGGFGGSQFFFMDGKGRISLALFYRSVTIEHQKLPVHSERMAKLFFEFLRRYNEWETAKFQEALWMLILLFLGFCILFFPLFLHGRGLIISIIMLIFFCFAAFHYLKLNRWVCHLAVNVNILHHHLIGKLEVGFCNHSNTCNCVEDFLRYVITEYNISLY